MAWAGPPPVSRRELEVDPDQFVSVLVWGNDDPELVFLHGGGQNAHTWDTVVLALGRPTIAIDLPGHGRSDRRADRNYGPWRNADAVATVMEQLAPNAQGVVGMSLGGATDDPARRRPPRPHAAGGDRRRHPAGQRSRTRDDAGAAGLGSAHRRAAHLRLVRCGVRRDAGHVAQTHGSGGTARGPAQHRATRGRPVGVALRPVRTAPDGEGATESNWADFTPLWDDVSAITVPTMLVQGGDSVFVLPEDRAEFERRLPSVRWEVVPGAGHAVQSDQPLALAALIQEFVLDA